MEDEFKEYTWESLVQAIGEESAFLKLIYFLKCEFERFEIAEALEQEGLGEIDAQIFAEDVISYVDPLNFTGEQRER